MFESISKKSKKTLLFFMIVFFVILILLFLISMSEEEKNKEDKNREEKLTDTKIGVAVCPTYSELLLSKQDNWYNIIRTRNTAESLSLLDKNYVDYVLSGRPPKADESEYEYFYINKSGYSFLGDKSESFYVSDLKDEKIYSDLNESDIEFLKNDLNLNDIIIVEDIYDRPDNTLAITTWENTDYSRNNIVHVYTENNKRYGFSRTPIIYCKDCDKDILNLLIKTLNN